jgi:tRNA(Arg) A34 adenosine deaminase TadA
LRHEKRKINCELIAGLCGESMLTEVDAFRLRRAIRLAAAAREHGNHPFGALLVGPDGDVLAEAENSAVTDHDCTAHAELIVVRLASGRYDLEALAGSTLYSSTEPCVMCAGAIHWSGIGRVVYALSQERLRRLTGHDPAGGLPGLSCREVFARFTGPIEIVGPVLEAEAEQVHHGFWLPDVRSAAY